MTEKSKWRWGKYRWILLLVIILQIIFAGIYPPVMPNIQVPGEVITHIGSFALTNTLIATFLADIIILLLVLVVSRGISKGGLIPKGWANAMEAFVEFVFNYTQNSAGKWAKNIFPFFATITLLVLVCNWMELIPGVDSIGLFNIEHAQHALEAKGGKDASEACKTFDILPGVVGIGGERDCSKAVVPFVRVASTDLNFTVALALISVFMTQVLGVMALGPGYFFKFFNVKAMFSRPFFGFLDWAVSLLELVSELSKVLSFSFRLFGNIFAGSVLLFIVGSFVPVFVQSTFLMFEFFIGALQAIVFGMLTMIFMSNAVKGHGHEEKAQ